MADFHFASAFEIVSDIDPDRLVAICGEKTLSWRDYEQRAARLASLFAAQELSQPKVGLYLYNCNEYLEAQFAAFKTGGTSINVNYRYQSDELLYLLDNADVEVLVYHACFASRIREIRDRLPTIKLYLQVADKSGSAIPDFATDYDVAIENHLPAPRIPQDPDDIYMLYTGGTTGLPKGVMYGNGYLCEKNVAGRCGEPRIDSASAVGRYSGLCCPVSRENCGTLRLPADACYRYAG